MKKLIIAVVVAVFTVLFLAPVARADVNNFVINDFYGKYELFNDTNAGRLVVTETIELTYSDQNHGILRALPSEYRGNSLRLDIHSVKRDGQKEPFDTYQQAGNEVLKIGDGDKTITGNHTYEIMYEMRNVVAFFENYDEWYWDINGDQWAQPFENVRGEVVLPAGWSIEEIPSASCYTGVQGSTQSVCSITRTGTGYVFEASRPLARNETLTVAIPVQKGLFTPRTSADWYRDNAWQLVGVATGIGLSLVSMRQWQKWGRDLKGQGTIIPEYKPPNNLTPAEAGLLFDYSVDSRDLTATIIDLAIRGYIKIYEDEKKTFGIFKSRTFSLELVNEKIGGLKSHEVSLLQALFKKMIPGTKQQIDKISKTEMQSAVTSIRTRLTKALKKEHGLIDETPTRVLVVTWGIAAISLALVFIAGGGWGWIVGMALSAVAAIAFSLLMRRRTHAGVGEYEKLRGLKMYMDTAEKDRLKMMQSVDRPYAEPTHNYELFEKLLPFAVALGVEKSWAKQFDNIYREPPSWYNGNMATFNTIYFTNSLTSGISSLNSSFSTATSSSSSGAGGGGFSGGGGGGGGGGGW